MKIVQETLGTIIEYIPKLISATDQIVEKLQSEKQQEAFAILVQYIEGLQWVVKALTEIQNLGHELNIDTDEVNTFLLEIEEGLKIGDYVMLNDLIEYEISPLLSDWLKKVIAFEKDFSW
ncbi:hypothetical protein F9B85_03130 [Heliorestis acidaminivorans]|uniref:DUF8042 domain-containing protein n=1 Tax=Heliorestis acidaminivorans TaxID=553427 RepID=A0A6I0F811_9FIRM|nr:hypothetical protein [Heliorestis acidaminivorans]KAB2953628.1 hypothetical protein F9B85_03130 [Heliorestis acidaminivorans]